MGKITAMFMLVALAVAVSTTVVAASQGVIPARRSRFLLPSSFYGCSKKSSASCLAPGSPGSTCCDGQCVDTVASAEHCGGCNKVCKHGRTCCGGRCVDLMADKDNCGSCSNQCSKKCTYGVCDYA